MDESRPERRWRSFPPDNRIPILNNIVHRPGAWGGHGGKAEDPAPSSPGDPSIEIPLASGHSSM
eukprot:826674-Pyramimonas_sp.AAC.1